MVFNALTAARILNEPQGCRFSSFRKMLVPGRSTFSRNSGVRSAKGRILSRAAATCAALGNDKVLEINDLPYAGGTCLLEHMMRRRQILRRDAERFVERHIEGRAAADLGAVGHLADLAEDMF